MKTERFDFCREVITELLIEKLDGLYKNGDLNHLYHSGWNRCDLPVWEQTSILDVDKVLYWLGDNGVSEILWENTIETEEEEYERYWNEVKDQEGLTDDDYWETRDEYYYDWRPRFDFVDEILTDLMKEITYYDPWYDELDSWNILNWICPDNETMRDMKIEKTLTGRYKVREKVEDTCVLVKERSYRMDGYHYDEGFWEWNLTFDVVYCGYKGRFVYDTGGYGWEPWDYERGLEIEDSWGRKARHRGIWDFMRGVKDEILRKKENVETIPG